jgi:hypothetical protein
MSGFPSSLPPSHITRFKANEEAADGAVGIGGSGLTAKVARRDTLHCVLDSGSEELSAAADLDSATRRSCCRAGEGRR